MGRDAAARPCLMAGAPSGSDGRAGVFDSPSVAQRKRSAVLADPLPGLVRPPVLGSSCRAEGGARQLTRHWGGLVGKSRLPSPVAAPGWEAGWPAMPHSFCWRRKFCGDRARLLPLVRLQCTASFARHRWRIAGQPASHPGAGIHTEWLAPGRGCCSCHTTPQCPEEPLAATLGATRVAADGSAPHSNARAKPSPSPPEMKRDAATAAPSGIHPPGPDSAPRTTPPTCACFACAGWEAGGRSGGPW
ncbi:hypothetical protein QFZ41_000626 [Luteibacter sp. W1I16]